MKTRVVLMVLVLVAGAPSQQATRRSGPESRESAVVLVGAPVELADTLSFSIDAAPLPRLAILRGRRRSEGNAAFEVDGKVWGTAGGFGAGTELFDAALPLAGTPGTGKKITLGIRPMAPGVTVDRVEIIPASRVQFVIRDQATKEAIPGHAFIERVEGGTPPVERAVRRLSARALLVDLDRRPRRPLPARSRRP